MSFPFMPIRRVALKMAFTARAGSDGTAAPEGVPGVVTAAEGAAAVAVDETVLVDADGAVYDPPLDEPPEEPPLDEPPPPPECTGVTESAAVAADSLPFASTAVTLYEYVVPFERFRSVYVAPVADPSKGYDDPLPR